ncbi:toxin TcdB middle/N-terminal domain-containing protein [Methylobacterium brachiatum]|uniref:toxin TcdB middle/N-terminal domain-containing protein n=1 Tax=Methylobacterium brachiatum TaxID=269660 RepID=UPI00331462F1
MRRVLAAVWAVCIGAVVAGLPWGAPANAQNKTAVGTVAGTFDVDLSGSASYTIPIRIAPGATGMEPKLFLAYNSQSPGGSLGAGWSIIGFSAITRGPKSHFFDGTADGVRLQESDALYLDGQRLITVSTTGTGAARRIEYRKEIDDQSQIVQVGADFASSRFIVKTKGGPTILFDGSNGSRVMFRNGPTLLQAASRILDTTGNYIQFEYKTDEDGDYDVSTVRYTGRGRVDADGFFTSDRAGFAAVQFEYDTASRVVEAYVSGQVIRKKRRLRSIRSIVTDDFGAPETLWAQVSRYTLDYAERPTTGNRFVLSAVHQFGEDDSELAPTAFTYSEPRVGWKDAPYSLPLGVAFASKEQLAAAYRFVHFANTASMVPDLLFAAQINGHLEAFAYTNSNGTWTAAPSGFKPPFAFTNADSADLGAVLVDLNGDGRVDLLQSHKAKDGSQQRSAYVADSTAWKKADDFQLPFNLSVDGKRVTTLLFGRLISTGTQPDLVYESEGQLGFLENTGTGWRPNSALVPPVPLSRYARLIDVDCDGKLELVAIGKDAAGTPAWRVFRAAAAGWQEETRSQFLPSPHIPASIDPAAILEIKFPGSSCAGLIAATAQGGGVRAAIQTSTAGWISLPGKAPPFDLVDAAGRAAKPVAIDVDKDGRLDVIAHQLVPGAAPIKFAYRQTVSGWTQLDAAFEPPPLGSTDVNSLPRQAYLGDLDGDKFPEIILPGGSGTSLGRVWQGSSTGFNEVPDFGPKVPFTRKDQQDRGLRLLDLNGDGLPDIVFHREVSDPKADPLYKGAFINTGRGWLPAPGLAPPVPFAADYITGNPVQFVDVDGDGYLDMLYASRRANGVITKAYYRNDVCKLDDTEDEAVCGPRAQRDPRFNRKWVIQEKSPGVPSDLAPPQLFAAENVGDLGVRFADLNGDGRPDMLAGFLPADTSGGPPPVEYCQDVDGVQTCELNRAPFQVSAFINNGSSWVRTPSYDPQVPFVSEEVAGGRTKDLFVQVIDVDGDRLPDIVAGFKHPYDPNKDVFETWINTGSGWRNDTVIMLPTRPNGTRLFLDEPLRDPRALVHWADINGDGLADVVFSKRQEGTNESVTFFSTGRGFVNGGSPYAIATDAIVDRNGDPSFRLIDVNGDGLLDVLYSREVADGTKEAGLYLNNGSGFVAADKTLVERVPPLIDKDGLDQGVRLFDADGNGLLDVLQAFASGDANTIPTTQVLLNSGRRADVLAAIDTGFGLQTSIFYQTLLETVSDAATRGNAPWSSVYVPGAPAAFPLISPVPASYVVRRAIVDEGPGRQTAFSYRYGEYRVHALAMRPLGFRFRESFNEASQSQILTRTELLQDVKLRNSPVREASCWVPPDVTPPSASGDFARPLEPIWDNLCPASLPPALSQVRKLTETSNSWVLREGPVGGSGGLPSRSIRQISLERTRTTAFELDGGLLTSQTDTFTYDTNVDILKRRQNLLESLSERGDGTSVRTTNEYGQDDESRWFFGRLTRATAVKVGDVIRPSSTERHHEFRVAEFGYDSGTGLLAYEIANAHREDKAVRTTYVRDELGNVISSEVSALRQPSRKALTTFDRLGRFATLETNAVGHTVRRQPKLTTGAPITVTGPNGLSTRYEYDGFGRVLRETGPTGVASVSQFLRATDLNDPGAIDGLPVVYVSRTQTESLPPTIRMFDNKGRVLRTIAEGFTRDSAIRRPIQRDTVYDLLGRPIKNTLPYERGANVLWARVEYDRLGRVQKSTAPSGAETTRIYGSRPEGGQVLTVIDPLGRRTSTVTNMRSLPAMITDALGGTVQYAYDAGDRLLTMVGPTGATTSHIYNDVGQRVETADPDMGRWRYVYDPFGRLVEQIDAKQQITTIEYDLLGRPIRKAQNDATAWWEYDSAFRGIGKVASVRGSDGYREDYFYDEYGRQSRWSVVANDETFSTSTKYDQLGRVARVYYPNSVAVENVYDRKGFLTSVRNAHSAATYWTALDADQFGRTTLDILGNGLATRRTFETETGRPQSIFVGEEKEGAVLDLRLKYDLVGNLSARSEKTGTRAGQPINEAFEYDPLDRLIGMSRPNGTRDRYAFDAAGRITYKSGVGDYSYAPTVAGALAGEDLDAKPFHAVLATRYGVTRDTYGYDLNGNMVRGPTGTLEFTADNRMKLLFADQARWARFDYAPSGARYRQFARTGIEAVETLYVGSYERVTEFIGPLTDARRGKLVRHRVYLSNGDGVFATIETNGEYSELLSNMTGKRPNQDKSDIPRSLIEQTKVWYLHKDQLGSIIKITDETARVAAAFWYDPWGKRTLYVRDPKNVRPGQRLDDSWDRGFTGQEHLDKFSLVHMNGRVYNAATAQFTSADSADLVIGSSQALGRYRYAMGNPLRYTDPTGLWDWGGAIVGGIVGFVTGGPAGAAAGFIVGGNDESRKWVEQNWRQVVIVAVAIGVTVATGGVGAPTLGAAILAGMAGGAASGALSAALYGGSFDDVIVGAIRGAAIGGLSAGLFYGAGSLAGENITLGIASNGVAGGISQAAQGGDFWAGFAAGAVTKAFNSYVPEFDGDLANVARSATIGGTASLVSGGSFANGAITGAYSYLFNTASHRSMNALRAYGRYLGGSGEAVDIDMDTLSLREEAVYGRIKPDIDRATMFGDGDYKIDKEFNYNPPDLNNKLLVGNVTVKVSGYLSINRGVWNFSGHYSVKPDLYNMNQANRPFPYEQLTTMGRFFGGLTSKPYPVNIQGREDLGGRGAYDPSTRLSGR